MVSWPQSGGQLQKNLLCMLDLYKSSRTPPNETKVSLLFLFCLFLCRVEFLLIQPVPLILCRNASSLEPNRTKPQFSQTLFTQHASRLAAARHTSRTRQLCWAVDVQSCSDTTHGAFSVKRALWPKTLQDTFPHFHIQIRPWILTCARVDFSRCNISALQCGSNIHWSRLSRVGRPCGSLGNVWWPLDSEEI